MSDRDPELAKVTLLSRWDRRRGYAGALCTLLGGLGCIPGYWFVAYLQVLHRGFYLVKGTAVVGALVSFALSWLLFVGLRRGVLPVLERREEARFRAEFNLPPGQLSPIEDQPGYLSESSESSP